MQKWVTHYPPCYTENKPNSERFEVFNWKLVKSKTFYKKGLLLILLYFYKQNLIQKNQAIFSSKYPQCLLKSFFLSFQFVPFV